MLSFVPLGGSFQGIMAPNPLSLTITGLYWLPAAVQSGRLMLGSDDQAAPLTPGSAAAPRITAARTGTLRDAMTHLQGIALTGETLSPPPGTWLQFYCFVLGMG